MQISGRGDYEYSKFQFLFLNFLKKKAFSAKFFTFERKFSEKKISDNFLLVANLWWAVGIYFSSPCHDASGVEEKYETAVKVASLCEL